MVYNPTQILQNNELQNLRNLRYKINPFPLLAKEVAMSYLSTFEGCTTSNPNLHIFHWCERNVFEPLVFQINIRNITLSPIQVHLPHHPLVIWDISTLKSRGGTPEKFIAIINLNGSQYFSHKFIQKWIWMKAY